MVKLSPHKVIGSLPPTLEPDSLYLVRVGAGFDLYATNENGVIVAYPLNVQSPSSLIQIGGRVYCYADNRWSSGGDDQYGVHQIQWNENSGTGVDPIFEWEHQGVMVPAGFTLNEIIVAGRVNSNEVSEVELYFVQKVPNTPAAWEAGFDADGEVTVTDIYRGLWWNNVDPGQPIFCCANSSILSPF